MTRLSLSEWGYLINLKFTNSVIIKSKKKRINILSLSFICVHIILPITCS